MYYSGVDRFNCASTPSDGLEVLKCHTENGRNKAVLPNLQPKQ